MSEEAPAIGDAATPSPDDSVTLGTPTRAAEPSPSMRLAMEAEGRPDELAARLGVQAALLAADEDEARCHLERTFARTPGHRPAIERLRRLSAATEQWDDAVRQYERLVPLESTPEARRELLVAMAVVRGQRQGRFDLAQQLCDAVLTMFPDDPVALGLAAHYAARRGAHADEAARYALLVQTASDPILTQLGAARAARLTALNSSPGAVDWNRTLLSFDASNGAALSALLAAGLAGDLDALASWRDAEAQGPVGRLAELLAEFRSPTIGTRHSPDASTGTAAEALWRAWEARRRGAADEWRGWLSAAAAGSGDALLRSEALLELAALDEAAGDRKEARRRYREALALRPEAVEAENALEALTQRTPAEALSRLEAQLSSEEDRRERALLRLQIGSLQVEEGLNAAHAETVDALLALDDAEAIDALLLQLLNEGPWVALAEVLRRLASSETNAEAALHLAMLAIVREYHLGDLPGAIEVQRELVARTSETPALLGLLRLLFAANSPQETVRQLQAIALDDTTPARLAAALLVHGAHVQERELDDPSGAKRSLESALTRSEGHLGARLALIGLRQRHGALFPEVELTRPGARERRLRAGLSQLDADPATLWAAAGEIAPATKLLLTLQSAFVRGQRFGVRAALEELSGRIETPSDKGFLTFLAGLVCLVDEQNPQLALERLSEASGAENGDALRLLSARIAAASGLSSAAVGTLRSLLSGASGGLRIDLARQLAALLTSQGDDSSAAGVLLSALEEAPRHAPSLVDAIDALERAGDGERAAELRGRLAALAQGARAAVLLRMTNALMHDDNSRRDSAAAEFRRVLSIDGTVRAARDAWLDVSMRRGDHAGAYELLETIASTLAPEERAAIAFERAQLLGKRSNPALVKKALEESLATDPSHLPALRELRHLAEASTDWASVADHLVKEATLLGGSPDALPMQFEAAAKYEQAGRLETAEALLLKLLTATPGEPVAVAGIERMLSSQGRYSELVAIFEREAEYCDATPVRSAELYTSAARIRFEKLGEDRRALVPLNRALTRDPANVRAQALKAKLALLVGTGDELQDAIHRALQEPGADRPALLVRLAELHLSAGRHDEALDAARRAQQLDDSRAVRELVYRIAVASGDPHVADEALEKLIDVLPEAAEGARLALDEARSRKNAGDASAASNWFRKAVLLAPGDAEAVDGLERLHLERGDLAGLAEGYEALATASRADPVNMRRHLAKAAAAWERSGAPAKAIGVYQNAVQAAPENPVLRLLLARMLGRHPQSRAGAFEELRQLAARPPLYADLFRELSRQFELDGRRDAAFVALGCLVGLGAATDDEMSRHAQLAATAPHGPRQLTPEECTVLVHPNESSSQIHALLKDLGPALPRLLPGDLGRHDVGRSDRLPAGELRSAVEQLAMALGVAPVEALVASRHPRDGAIEATLPPTLLFGKELVSGPISESRFVAGQLLGRLRVNTHALFAAAPIEVASLVAEVLRTVDPQFDRFGVPNASLAASLAKEVGPAERAALESLKPRFSGAVNFGQFTQAMGYTSHRFGLVASGDAAAALRALTRDVGKPTPPVLERADVRELVTFAVGEEHLSLRQKLNIALS